MVDETLAAPARPIPAKPMPAKSIPPKPMPASRATTIGALVAEIGLAALALSFVWSEPARNTWAAAALVAGLCLDGLGRIVGRIALSRVPVARPGLLSSVVIPSVVIPSVILASERGLLAAAFLFAIVLVVWPNGFPIFASVLAGLLAMGGLARLAIARAVTAAPSPPDEQRDD